jgi:hypothetical protein
MQKPGLETDPVHDLTEEMLLGDDLLYDLTESTPGEISEQM